MKFIPVNEAKKHLDAFLKAVSKLTQTYEIDEVSIEARKLCSAPEYITWVGQSQKTGGVQDILAFNRLDRPPEQVREILLDGGWQFRAEDGLWVLPPALACNWEDALASQVRFIRVLPILRRPELLDRIRKLKKRRRK